MKAANTIKTPTIILDKNRCLQNIHKMARTSKQAGIRLRPHCKTHASLEIARWFREEAGVTCITVSSLSMAQYFASEWNDITVAFPVNILEIDTINDLVSSHDKLQLNLLVENTDAVEVLTASVSSSVGIYIKIDVGYGRTGIPGHETDRIDNILQLLQSSQKLQFLGFLSHAGHSYYCRSKEEIYNVFQKSRDVMTKLKQQYISGFPDLQLSFGDTPCCSVIDPKEFKVFDEIRPGNFVFYDLEQATIGSCELDNIAITVACPIVAKHKSRRELTLYGGGIHFCKQGLEVNDDGTRKTIFGRVVKAKDDTWGDDVEGMYIRSLSQEHGMVVVPNSEDFNQYRIGEVLLVLPVHSCMTADCLKHQGYLTTDLESIERMKN